MGVTTVIKDYGTQILDAIREHNAPALIALLEKQLRQDHKIAALCVTDIKHRPSKKFACPLILAARQEDPTILRYMMDKGVDPNFIHHTVFSSKRHEVVTAMHIAVDLCLYQNVEVLLNANADPNLADHNKETPLHIAVKKSDRVMTRLLLAKGANPTIVDNNRNAALHYATLYGHLQLVKTLLKYDADVYQKGHQGEIPSHIAAREGHIHLVQVFCSRDEGNINIKIPCFADQREKAPLHLAAENGHVETVIALLDQFNASVNLKDSDGNTALHCVVLNMYHPYRMREKDYFYATAKVLVKYHVSINEKNRYGETALHLAAANQHQKIVELLLSVGANPFAENDNHQKPIDLVPDSDPVTKQRLKSAMTDPRPPISASMLSLNKDMSFQTIPAKTSTLLRNVMNSGSRAPSGMPPEMRIPGSHHYSRQHSLKSNSSQASVFVGDVQSRLTASGKGSSQRNQHENEIPLYSQIDKKSKKSERQKDSLVNKSQMADSVHSSPEIDTKLLREDKKRRTDRGGKPPADSRNSRESERSNYVDERNRQNRQNQPSSRHATKKPAPTRNEKGQNIYENSQRRSVSYEEDDQRARRERRSNEKYGSTQRYDPTKRPEPLKSKKYDSDEEVDKHRSRSDRKKDEKYDPTRKPDSSKHRRHIESDDDSVVNEKRDFKEKLRNSEKEDRQKYKKFHSDDELDTERDRRRHDRKGNEKYDPTRKPDSSKHRRHAESDDDSVINEKRQFKERLRNNDRDDRQHKLERAKQKKLQDGYSDSDVESDFDDEEGLRVNTFPGKPSMIEVKYSGGPIMISVDTPENSGFDSRQNTFYDDDDENEGVGYLENGGMKQRQLMRNGYKNGLKVSAAFEDEDENVRKKKPGKTSKQPEEPIYTNKSQILAEEQRKLEKRKLLEEQRLIEEDRIAREDERERITEEEERLARKADREERRARKLLRRKQRQDMQEDETPAVLDAKPVILGYPEDMWEDPDYDSDELEKEQKSVKTSLQQKAFMISESLKKRWSSQEEDDDEFKKRDDQSGFGSRSPSIKGQKKPPRPTRLTPSDLSSEDQLPRSGDKQLTPDFSPIPSPRLRNATPERKPELGQKESDTSQTSEKTKFVTMMREVQNIKIEPVSVARYGLKKPGTGMEDADDLKNQVDEDPDSWPLSASSTSDSKIETKTDALEDSMQGDSYSTRMKSGKFRSNDLIDSDDDYFNDDSFDERYDKEMGSGINVSISASGKGVRDASTENRMDEDGLIRPKKVLGVRTALATDMLPVLTGSPKLRSRSAQQRENPNDAEGDPGKGDREKRDLEEYVEEPGSKRPVRMPRGVRNGPGTVLSETTLSSSIDPEDDEVARINAMVDMTNEPTTKKKKVPTATLR